MKRRAAKPCHKPHAPVGNVVVGHEDIVAAILVVAIVVGAVHLGLDLLVRAAYKVHFGEVEDLPHLKAAQLRPAGPDGLGGGYVALFLVMEIFRVRESFFWNAMVLPTRVEHADAIISRASFLPVTYTTAPRFTSNF